MKTVTLTNKSSNTLSFPNFYIEKYSSYNIELNEIQFDEELLNIIYGYVTDVKLSCYLDSVELSPSEILTLKYRDVYNDGSIGKDETVADMDIYVNATTGADVLGDGSSSSPYSTITRAYADVPTKIKHVVHIHIAAGTYSAWPSNIDHSFIDAGFLSFDGSLALVDASTEMTIDVAGPTVIQTNNVADIPVVGGGLTSNAYRGKYVKFTSGARVGEVAAIVSNTTTSLRIEYTYIALSAGETFKVVEPGVTIVSDQFKNLIGGGGNTYFANHGLFGLDIDFSSKRLVVQDCCINMTGSIISGTVQFHDTTTDMGLYYYPSPTDVVDDSGLVSNYNTNCIMKKGTGTDYLTVYGSSDITRLFVFDKGIDVAYSNCLVGYCAIANATNGYGVDAYASVGCVRVAGIYIEAKTNNQAVRLPMVGSANVDAVFVESAQYGVKLWPGVCGVTIKGLEGTAANVTNAIAMGQGSRAVIENSSCTLVGAGGAATAIKWLSGGAIDTAYPAANAEVNDTLGSQIVGY